MTSTPDAADARLLGAHDLALAALHEITPAHTVGAAAGYTIEDDGAVSLRFASAMAGYPDWFWTVSVAVVDGSEPTVLEAELLPGEGSLLAPEWVPWAVRLADYQAAQAALAAEQGDDLDDLGDDDLDADDVDDDADDESDIDDLDDLDAADFDQDGSPILHAGDVDGVDIDVLDEDAPDDDDDDADQDDDLDEDDLEDDDLDDDDLEDDEDD